MKWNEICNLKIVFEMTFLFWLFLVKSFFQFKVFINGLIIHNYVFRIFLPLHVQKWLTLLMSKKKESEY